LSAWSADLAEVIYLDHFGNAVTGLTYRFDWKGRRLRWQGGVILHARTFADVPEGHPLWYMNSMGLVEIAVNRGNASVQLGLDVGHPVSWE
ncbi:MAG: SAM-dependent chlorinase/fluorinase, partial [Methylothermaceae bacterium]|nr:SAM-dependent chlorinase/fluorinase [Methylothermaceae bacterium]